MCRLRLANELKGEGGGAPGGASSFRREGRGRSGEKRESDREAGRSRGQQDGFLKLTSLPSQTSHWNDETRAVPMRREVSIVLLRRKGRKGGCE